MMQPIDTISGCPVYLERGIAYIGRSRVLRPTGALVVWSPCGQARAVCGTPHEAVAVSERFAAGDFGRPA